jgi:hypothetical protein
MNFPILSENRSKPSVIYILLHTKKLLVKYQLRCSTVNCYALISLKVDRATQQIQQPIEVKNTNKNHT